MTTEFQGDEKRAHDMVHEILQKTSHDVNIIEGAFLTKWVIVTEWASPDGGRMLAHMAHEDATVWDLFGMLRAATKAAERYYDGDG